MRSYFLVLFSFAFFIGLIYCEQNTEAPPVDTTTPPTDGNKALYLFIN